MVGFIKGIFGAKQTADPESTQATQPPEATPKLPKTPKQKPEAFYLDTSDARTLGNLDYLQTVREIRRTFPKTFGEEPRAGSNASAQPAPKQAQPTQQAQASKGTASLPATFAAQSPPVSGWTSPKADKPIRFSDPKERRQNDASLDTFRTIARDLPKFNHRRR